MNAHFTRSALPALILGVFLSLSAAAQSQTPGKRNSPALLAYGENRERLPAQYEGVNSKEFFRVFKRNLGTLKKGKSETVEQFRVRGADAKTVFRTIGTTRTYAFRIKGLSAQFDAGKQAYVFGGKSRYGCLGSSFLEGYITCGISESVPVAKKTDGAEVSAVAKKTVKARHEVHGLAIPLDSSFVRDSFKLDRNQFYFIPELRVSPETASRIKDQGISVLFVGNVIEEKFVNEQGKVVLPVLTDRRDATIVGYDVPFRVRKIVYYVYQTGEILKQTDF